MVSIVILSYNTKALLKSCLASIYKHVKSITFEIIVVDNASRDGTVEMIQKEFPQVQIIKNDQNLGFSKGSNIGAKRAKGSTLVFLNSDIELLDDNFDKTIELFVKSPALGAVGGSLLHPDGTQQRSFSSFYNLFHVATMLVGGDKIELRHKYSVLKQVDWVSGGFLFIKKKIFDELRGFDENFFMYVEDMEFCYRLYKHGYTVVFNPQLKAMHRGQGSSNRTFAILQIYKGILYFYKKHKTFTEYIIVKVFLTTKAICALVIGSLTHNTYLTSTYKKALAI